MERNHTWPGVITVLLGLTLLCCRAQIRYPTSTPVGSDTSPFLGDIAELIQDNGRVLKRSVERRERFIAVHLKLLENGSPSRTI